MKQKEIRIVEADLDDPVHQKVVLKLVDEYSKDEMGDGKALSDEARKRLVSGLREHPTTMILVAYKREEPIGIAVCFRGFSTFAAQPLMNIHDLAVLPGHRGEGIGSSLLEAVERKAKAMGCCKMTLEVLENNPRARAVYEAAGFSASVTNQKPGNCFFLSKRI